MITSNDEKGFSALRGEKEELEKKAIEAYQKLRDEVADTKKHMDLEKSAAAAPQKSEGDEGKEKAEQATEVPVANKGLIYFSYSMYGQTEHPPWAATLQKTLTTLGYLVFNPWISVTEQFDVGKDLGRLNSLPKRIMPSICPMLKLQESILFPLEAVGSLFDQAETSGDHDCFILRSLWFLVRSSLVISDLTRSPLGMGVAQELMYAKLFDIPSIGVLPDSGQINAWISRSTTVLIPSAFNLQSVLPLVRGYASRG
jgi:hypothetical protein